jgi:uncharacterized protein YjiS (DUF1127 family)
MSLMNLFVAGRAAIAGWRQRQRAYGELMALDDRSLADIGIRREEIRAIVEGYYDEGPSRASAPAHAAAPSYRHAGLAATHRWLPGPPV